MVVHQSGLEDTSLLSLPMDQPGIANCAVSFTDTPFRSARDTSHTERDSQETSRLAASNCNIHSSILDITEDCDDDDEENADRHSCNFLFPDSAPLSVGQDDHPLNESLDYDPQQEDGFEESPTFHTEVSSPTFQERHSCCAAPLTPACDAMHMTGPRDMNTSLLDRMTESFVESLCFGKKDVVGTLETVDNHMTWEGTKRLLEYDILELLGCASAPDEDEMEQVWAWNQSMLNCVRPEQALGNNSHDHMNIPSPPRPRRHSARQRAARLHRLRTERDILMEPKHTTLFPSPSPSPTSVLQITNRVRSMDDRILQRMKDPVVVRVCQLEDDLEKRIGFGIDPILREEEELGYDSDPEDFLENRLQVDPPVLLSPIRSKAKNTNANTSRSNPKANYHFAMQEENVGTTVQDSLNLTWTLTWHRGKDVSRQHGVCINAWIERGTMVQSSNLMLEPNLMWREAYQADLGIRKLNASSQKPFNVRLLNLCRILEAPANLDRSIYPLARISCSFMVKTSDDQEFLFEAASVEERDEVVRRWKLCVARFATLAVLEDMRAITLEFFSPMITSQMLVPDYH